MSSEVLDDIAARITEGQALTDADAEALASTYDIVSLGMIADDLRRARHGTRTTFLRVAHVAGVDGREQSSGRSLVIDRQSRAVMVVRPLRIEAYR